MSDSLGHEARFPLTPDEEQKMEDRYHDFPPEGKRVDTLLGRKPLDGIWGVIIGVSKCTRCGAIARIKNKPCKGGSNE